MSELQCNWSSIYKQPYDTAGDGPALQDLIGGDIHAMFTTGPSSLGHVQSGRLKALAVGTKARLPHLPNVPTVAELGMPGFEAVSWGGVLVPANTPRPVVLKLNAEINRILAIPEVRAALAKTGSETVGNSPEEFEAYIAFETGKWANVAKIANIKGEIARRAREPDPLPRHALVRAEQRGVPAPRRRPVPAHAVPHRARRLPLSPRSAL